MVKPGFLNAVKNKASQFYQLWVDDVDSEVGYDAIKGDNPNRRPVRRRVYSEDRRLRRMMRERAIATAQDINRNFAVVAWAIRKHLDYVSDMKFKGDTGNDEVDTALETFMLGWSDRHMCDVKRRDSLRRMIRLSEMRRLVDGDFFMLKIGGQGPNRGKMQAIEGYRIQNPPEEETSDNVRRWVNGVLLGAGGQAIRYSVWHRTDEGNMEHDGVIPAPNMAPVGYYERFDQVRGISPLLAGLGEFADVMDSVTLMKSKLKLQQLFAFATFRDYEPSTADGLPGASGDGDQDGIADRDWQFNFSGKPQQIDGLKEDRFELLESKSPSQEGVDFMRFVLSIALKTLDLPDSFLRESETNFFGSRAALTQYLTSARSKQADLIEFLNEITRWRLGMAVADGDLQLDIPFEEIRWRWVHKGQPWAWDPVKEASGARMALEAGLDSMERVCMLNGTDPKDNIDELNQWRNYSESTYGRPLVLSNTSATVTAEADDMSEGQNE